MVALADPQYEEDDDDDGTLTPNEYIAHTIRYLRTKGKRISARHAFSDDPDFYYLTINGESCGLWGSIGLASVLSQYRNLTTPSYLKGLGLPLSL